MDRGETNLHKHIVFGTKERVLSITPEIQTRRYETSDTFWDNTLIGLAAGDRIRRHSVAGVFPLSLFHGLAPVAKCPCPHRGIGGKENLPHGPPADIERVDGVVRGGFNRRLRHR